MSNGEIFLNNIFYLIWLPIAMALFGSYIITIIDRIKDKTLFMFPFPVSHCYDCQHQLYPKDTFPVISYIINKGKCSYCKINIPKKYFITESIFFIIGIFLWYKLLPFNLQKDIVIMKIMSPVAILTIIYFIAKHYHNKTLKTDIKHS